MSLYQEELAVLKRQHVTRSLSFSTDTFERSRSHADAGDENMNRDGKIDIDAHDRSSLQDIQNSNNQVSFVH
jgi:kinesin family member 15